MIVLTSGVLTMFFDGSPADAQFIRPNDRGFMDNSCRKTAGFLNGGIYIMFNKIIYVVLVLFQFLCGCFVLVLNALYTTSKIKETVTAFSSLIAIIFQPALLVAISLALLKFMEAVIPNFIQLCIYNFYYGSFFINLLTLSMAIFPIQFFVFLFLSITELAFYFIHKEELFDKSFTLQYYGTVYILAIISLLAIYASLDSYNADSINFMIFLYGLLFTACMMMTDLYKRFYLSNCIVKNLYINLTGESEKATNIPPK